MNILETNSPGTEFPEDKYLKTKIPGKKSMDKSREKKVPGYGYWETKVPGTIFRDESYRDEYFADEYSWGRTFLGYEFKGQILRKRSFRERHECSGRITGYKMTGRSSTWIQNDGGEVPHRIDSMPIST